MLAGHFIISIPQREGEFSAAAHLRLSALTSPPLPIRLDNECSCFPLRPASPALSGEPSPIRQRSLPRSAQEAPGASKESRARTAGPVGLSGGLRNRGSHRHEPTCPSSSDRSVCGG